MSYKLCRCYTRSIGQFIPPSETYILGIENPDLVVTTNGFVYQFSYDGTKFYHTPFTDTNKCEYHIYLGPDINTQSENRIEFSNNEYYGWFTDAIDYNLIPRIIGRINQKDLPRTLCYAYSNVDISKWFLTTNYNNIVGSGKTVYVNLNDTYLANPSHLYKVTYSNEDRIISIVNDTDSSPNLVTYDILSEYLIDRYGQYNSLEDLGYGIYLLEDNYITFSERKYLYYPDSDEYSGSGWDSETNSPYEQGGQSSSGGGGGSYGGGTFGGGGTGGQSSSDDIASTLPVGGANNSIGASTMLYTRYLLSQADLDFIGEWLWSPNLGLVIAKEFVSVAFGSPIDAIISVYAYPFSIGGYLEGYSAQQQIFCYGGARAAIAGRAQMANALLNNAVAFNWGSLKIDEYWGNFLDYAPHTTVELYLPWGVGFVSLDPNQVMGRTLTISTNIDLTKGTCVHNIFDDLGCVIGTYSGQCAKQLPMTSLDNASKIAGITAAAVGTAVSLGGAIGSGYSAGTKNMIAGGASHTGYISGDRGRVDFFDVQSPRFNADASMGAGVSTFEKLSKPAIASAAAIGMRPSQVQRNGSFSDASSFMGVQYPYIILSRPTQSVPEEYGHHYGYPSNIYQGLRYLSGYTEIGEIHLQGIPCTESELSELDKMLKGGVLF